MSNFKTKFCWWPVRLARRYPVKVDVDVTENRMEFIGWAWLQTANLTRNLNHGWIALLDSEPLKPRCRKCGQLLPRDAGE
jgi:hypothetical protein